MSESKRERETLWGHSSQFRPNASLERSSTHHLAAGRCADRGASILNVAEELEAGALLGAAEGQILKGEAGAWNSLVAASCLDVDANRGRLQ